jgi:hypothetical protein
MAGGGRVTGPAACRELERGRARDTSDGMRSNGAGDALAGGAGCVGAGGSAPGWGRMRAWGVSSGHVGDKVCIFS